MKAVMTSQKEQVKALLNIAFDTAIISDIKKCSYKESNDKIIVNNAHFLTPIIRAKLTNILLVVYPWHQIFFKDNSSIWTNVREYAKTHPRGGENIDKSWFSKLLPTQRENEIILASDSTFMVSWVKNHYLNLIEEGFALHGYILDQYSNDKSIRFIKNNKGV